MNKINKNKTIAVAVMEFERFDTVVYYIRYFIIRCEKYKIFTYHSVIIHIISKRLDSIITKPMFKNKIGDYAT